MLFTYKAQQSNYLLYYNHMYTMLRGFLRQLFWICNLGLVKKNDLKSFQKNNTLFNNLESKIAFYFVILQKVKMGRIFSLFFLIILKMVVHFVNLVLTMGLLLVILTYSKKTMVGQAY